MAKLVLTLNGKVINQYFIDKPSITLGRNADNDIVINDPLISGAHARIAKMGKDDVVEDLQSSNGSQVNGKALARHILQHSDVITLGSHQLRYMSARIASEVDFDRTMLIQTLARPADIGGDAAAVINVSPTASAKTRLSQGSVAVIGVARGLSLHEAGQMIRLEQVVTTFGVPGEQLVVLTRRPSGVFLTHVEGAKSPRVNQKSVGNAPYALKNDDLIDAAGYQLKFIA